MRGRFAVSAMAMLALASPAIAQQSTGSPQSATVQMQCRTLTSSNNYLNPGETLVNGMACHPAAVQTSTKAPAETANATPSTVAAPVTPAAPAQTSAAAAPAAVSAQNANGAPENDGKTRVFVTDSQSWETRGGSAAGGTGHGWASHSWMSGGARPQTAEIIKTLNQRCPEIIVTDNPARADFVLTLDHEGGKSALARHNKIALFNRDGDDVFSTSTRSLGNAVNDACKVMLSSHK